MSTKVDKVTAAVLDYNGIESNRVEVFDRDKPVFFVHVKKFDLQAIQQEMQNESVTVYLPALLRSLKRIEDLVQQARVSGVWSGKV
jgi:hypothetical protein